MSGKFTSEQPRPEFDFAVLSPAGSPESSLPIAASRAGALGVLNLEFATATDHDAALNELDRLAQLGRGRCSALIADEELLTAALAERFDGLETIVLPDARAERLADLVRRVQSAGVQAQVIATRLDDALAAVDAGADAVIAKGHEAGGWIDEEGSFVLLQRLIAAVHTPVWAYGGIGLHTVNAAYVAGAAGVVLDAQLLLARESPLPESLRSRIASMDGSETEVLGSGMGAPFRVYSRPGAEGSDALREIEARLESTADARDAWRAAVGERVGWDASEAVLPIGQDASFANDLAERFQTVGGILGAFRDSIVDGWESLQRSNPLAEGAPLAESHGTTYPIVQGPMTRVSDRADFAAAVAEAGALPLLALALMRAPEVHELLERTGQLLDDRAWGVGILGFVPPELRAEQLEVLLEYRPPFALIAGGRPDQARALEDEGIATYLHVPSPGLLKLYLADGARRFVFEGRECGGHVGPRTSFVLWDTMVRTLLDELPPGGDDCHVLLAGGIHDATSAAMLAGTASALADRGVRVGALLGTAYLFTHEATEHGAITERFQEAAIAGRDTALVESGPGHATRCLPSPFVEQFNVEKRRLRGEGVAADELRGRLEQLNIGRLRIASKGADRNPRFGEDPEAPKLVEVDPAEQWERGMYMIGQVAALRDRTTSLADLHRDVSEGSSELVEALPAPEVARAAPPAQADVAIVGVGCILPGAGDASTFWSNIMDKVDAIREVPEDRWDWRRYYDPDPSARDKIYSRWGGFVDEASFDPIAFGLPPNSLTSIEPFQLLALLTARAALSDAGYAMRPFDRERTSVVLGAGGGGADLAVGYTVRSALPSLLGDAAPDLGERLNERLPEWTEDSFAGLLMNVAAGRIANRLDFGGANYTVDAACASSLAAIGLGVRELQSGTSDMVLAGGVDAIQNPFAYLCFSKTHALSPNGHCRPFDAAADGIAISEGFATVVLKRLADAERDGDRIYAVVRGVGAASDGRDRSLTAPRPEGQMRALRRAYAQARFSPATVELVEAHGTGTVAGDGAEVQALSRLFAEHAEDSQWCAIGSIKSMIGHTKATAGVAGLIKAALALHHRVLPPTIGVTEPNPKANFPASPFYVNTEPRPWLSGANPHPRRAGVSAFGFGGTDFHIVLEEYTGDYLRRDESAVDRWPAELFLWRGTRDDISASLGSLAARLGRDHEYRLADLARTVAFEARAPEPGDGTLAVVADSLDDLHAKLAQALELLAGSDARVHTANGIHWSEQPLAADARVALLFPGQGSQFVGMGREIALAFPEAHECFERADRTLADRYDRPLSRYIFPPPAFTPDDEQRQQAELTETHVAQAALGATDLAYLHVLEGLGVEPEMVGGHSYGEFVALAAAGGLAVDDLLRLSEARGRFMREAAADAPGAMAAVDATPEMLEPLLSQGEVVAANLNAPDQTVLSGLREHIDAAIEWCRERDIAARALPVACAFHSRYVAPAQQRLAEVLDDTPLDSPAIPVFSNTTGERHAVDPAEIATLLREHLGSRVDFVSEIDAMYRDGARVFVEVGPRSVLTALVGRILGEREHVAVPVDRPGRPGLTQLLHCLAAIAAEGVPLRMDRLFRGRSAERIELGGTDADSRSHPPGTWLVHGGRARPADVPFESPAPITSYREEERPVTNTSDGGAPPGQVLTPAATNGQAAELAPAEPIIGEPVAGDRVGDVMSRYHQMMQHFLETQRSVMLAYLGAPRPTVDVRPTPARSAPLPPPPTTPVQPPQPTAPPVVEAPAVSDAVPVAVPPPPTGNGHGTLSAEEIKDLLLSVVSERTGYPAEMLGLDADLEGDLGIDSIKRVEIAGTLAQTLALPDGGELDVERLTASRTLREVIAALEEAVAPNAAPAEDLSPEDLSPFEDGPADEERIGRFVLEAASAPAITATAGLAAAGAVVIVDDETGVGEALAEALAEQGEATVRLTPADLPEDAEAATQLAERLREEHGGAKALVHLAALGVCGGSDAGLPTLLLLAQALREDLEHAAAGGGAVVLGASRLGGGFGIDGQVPDGAAPEAAVPGFLKTLAQEWPAMRVKAVDLSAAPREEDASHLLAEMAAADGLVEVGYRDGQRTDLRLVPASLADRAEAEPISAESVVLVTGGARGITAEVAVSLAERYRCTLLLVGRTLPGEEAQETAGATELAELRQVFIEARRRAGEQVTPALVEEDCRRVLREREVRHNLARLARTGARVEYLTCDVRDAAAFGTLIDEAYVRYGRIDGVIHGAGVIEDRLIRDKRRDSLERVVATKAGAARTLAEKLRPDSLRFLTFFSSVSGRFGNRGQADYAAASEVLNKLAQELDRRWPARVQSINWGPWRKTGMVSPEVEREFARRGVALIPVDVGCRLMDDELRRARKSEVEVVIGAATGVGREQPLLARAANVTRADDGSTEVLRTLDLRHDRYLDSHRVDGRPVLPFAVAMELMAEAATVARPGLDVTGLRDIRLLQGVTVADEAGTAVRVAAVPGPSGSDVDVTIGEPGGGRRYYRALVDLGTPASASAATAAAPEPLPDLAPFPMEVHDAYRELLFHGPLFQGISAIEGMDERGARAVLQPSTPGRCMTQADGLEWLLDPILLDSALQMQVLWARLHWDVTLLPAEIRAHRCAVPAYTRSGDPVRHELRIRPGIQSPLCHADHWFYAPDGTLLATLGDVVGVGTQALNRLAAANA